MIELSDLRKVVNIDNLKWDLIEEESGEERKNVWWYNLSFDAVKGEGTYLYKMEPGARSNPHEHLGPEEFFILEGNLIDNDGFEYKKGDLVSLGTGTRHFSISPQGCTIVVTHRGNFNFIKKESL